MIEETLQELKDRVDSMDKWIEYMPMYEITRLNTINIPMNIEKAKKFKDDVPWILNFIAIIKSEDLNEEYKEKLINKLNDVWAENPNKSNFIDEYIKTLENGIDICILFDSKFVICSLEKSMEALENFVDINYVIIDLFN